MKPAKYNPHNGLIPGDYAFHKIDRCMNDFGYNDPAMSSVFQPTKNPAEAGKEIKRYQRLWNMIKVTFSHFPLVSLYKRMSSDPAPTLVAL